MSNRHTLQAAIDEENRRKKRALMSDTYNLDCSRMPPSEPYKDESLLGTDALNAHRARHNLPPLPTYPVADDSGQRLRRSDKPAEKVSDPVNQPAHYRAHASGIECITITEHFNFCIGNAIKYLWRGADDLKGEGLQDLKKARWYIDREIAKREKAPA